MDYSYPTLKHHGAEESSFNGNQSDIKEDLYHEVGPDVGPRYQRISSNGPPLPDRNTSASKVPSKKYGSAINESAVYEQPLPVANKVGRFILILCLVL